MNRVILIGRFTGELELKETAAHIPVLASTLAVDRVQSSDARAAGEEKVTDFIRCIFWRSQASFVARFGRKGGRIMIEGKMQVRKYVDKDGVERSITEVNVHEVEIIDWKEKESASSAAAV